MKILLAIPLAPVCDAAEACMLAEAYTFDTIGLLSGLRHKALAANKK